MPRADDHARDQRVESQRPLPAQHVAHGAEDDRGPGAARHESHERSGHHPLALAAQASQTQDGRDVAARADDEGEGGRGRQACAHEEPVGRGGDVAERPRLLEQGEDEIEGEHVGHGDGEHGVEPRIQAPEHDSGCRAIAEQPTSGPTDDG